MLTITQRVVLMLTYRMCDTCACVIWSRTSPSGALGHYHFTGRVVHAETLGFGCVHGVKFTDMTAAERSTLLDYLCQVEHQYRVAS